MAIGGASKSAFEKGRRAEMPGAKLGNDSGAPAPLVFDTARGRPDHGGPAA